MYNEVFYVEVLGQKYKFFGDFSFDKDAEDCMGTGTLRMPYHPKLWGFWEPGFTELVIVGGVFDEERLFLGRTRGIKQDGEYIEIALQDCGWQLKQIYQGQIQDGTKVRDAFNSLVKEAGMEPVILGLKQEYTAKDDSKSSSSGGIDSSSYSGGSTAYDAVINVAQMREKYSPVVLQNINVGGKPASQVLDEAEKSGQSGGSGGGSSGNVIKVTGRGSCRDGLSEGSGTKCYINKCPGCGRTGSLQDNPKGVAEHEITCGNANSGDGSGCNADFCVMCGRSKDPVPGSIGGTLTPSPNCDGAGSGGGSEEEEKPGTYEDAIKKMCQDSGNDLIFFTDQYNRCFLVDYPTLIEDIEKNAFVIEQKMMEYPSFKMDVNQFGFANTVVVKYANGEVKESYEDLVMVFGEVKKTVEEPKKTREEAKKFALGKLATLLRDFAIEIEATVLYSGKITPGDFVKLTNPLTKNEELYYVSGINITHSPNSTLKCSLKLLFAPRNPLVDQIPEIRGTPETLSEVAKKYAKFGYGSTLPNGAYADCFGMSTAIHQDLEKAGINARVISYYSPVSTSGTHRTVQYESGGKWVNFPYSQFHFHKNFGIIQSSINAGYTIIEG